MLANENVFFAEESIDPERVVNDEHRIANEFVCAICQGLLWKAKSCSSCQHLFCHQCIRTWLQINPTSCPFRCSPYEEKRPPPYIHSLLGRLSIRCRNSSFGCQEILPYDLLEQHETIECPFLTKRCLVCGENILINEFDQHRTSCLPARVQCSICRQWIDRVLLGEHTGGCFRGRIDLFIDQALPLPDNQIVPLNNPLTLGLPQENGSWLAQFITRIEQFLNRLPRVDLLGFDEVVRARERNILIRIWTMLQMIWLNKSQAIPILCLLICFRMGFFGAFLFHVFLSIQNGVENAIYRSYALIIIFTGLFNFTLPLFLASVSDIWIITFTTIFMILWSSASPMLPLDYFKVSQSTKIFLAISSICLIMFELSLLLLRLYVWLIPCYISAGCLAWILMFITFQIRRLSLNRRRTIRMN